MVPAEIFCKRRANPQKPPPPEREKYPNKEKKAPHMEKMPFIRRTKAPTLKLFFSSGGGGGGQASTIAHLPASAHPIC